MRLIKIQKGNLDVKDKIVGFFEKEIVVHGTGGKVLCPKKYVGKKAYVIIRE